MTNLVRLLVLSDLHATCEAPNRLSDETKLSTNESAVAVSGHPFKAILQLIAEENVRADFVVCPGDMTNKAEPQALEYVWRKLHELKHAAGAKAVLATAGNHDVDSRGHSGDGFPREWLMRLKPSFPSGDDDSSNRYWAHGYCFHDYPIDDGRILRFLLLNSCWLHEARDELERGVLPTYVLDKVREDLAKLPRASRSVALCHHHPQVHSELGLGYDDTIRNGQTFLDLLAENSSWLVVHGHKHHAKLSYAQGDVQRPVVFAAGSFSGRLQGTNAVYSRNYFHVIEVDLTLTATCGTVETWSWLPGEGWIKAAPVVPRGFPCFTGFGFEGSIDEIIEKLTRNQTYPSLLAWQEYERRCPEARYLTPKQQRHLFDRLKSEHKINIVFNDLGAPEQIVFPSQP
jgi:predicted phosphodiesterase